jgi:GMC oxidoreductase
MFSFNARCTRPCSRNIPNGFSLMASVPCARLTNRASQNSSVFRQRANTAPLPSQCNLSDRRRADRCELQSHIARDGFSKPSVNQKGNMRELTVNPGKPDGTANFAERVRVNQRKLRSELKPHYDFIVCGSGSSGSVVAGRLAENPDVSVLLLEAGGDDDVPSVTEVDQWPMNLRTERDWSFQGQPNAGLNGRSIPFSAGKVLGGGSSINAMIWARGHKSDWDFFGSEAGDPAWSYESVLSIYRRIEDWRGAPDPKYRGTGGRLFVQPALTPIRSPRQWLRERARLGFRPSRIRTVA